MTINTARVERFGVFLRPDPRTCAAVVAVTAALRAQYGFVSAGAFPPHATLVGSLPVVGVSEVLAALDPVLPAVPAFPVANAGVDRMRTAIVYDVHQLDGVPNAAFVALAHRVEEVLTPLLVPAPGLAPDVPSTGRWHGHLSLASHELGERPDLADEIEEFVRGLDVAVPASFLADTVSAYRFTHPTWTGPWWTDLRWEHLRSWRLSTG